MQQSPYKVSISFKHQPNEAGEMVSQVAVPLSGGKYSVCAFVAWNKFVKPIIVRSNIFFIVLKIYCKTVKIVKGLIFVLCSFTLVGNVYGFALCGSFIALNYRPLV